jgi:hypothetical protein
LIIAIACRLANFDANGLPTNPTLLQAKYIAWTQTELAYSIIAATIPRLRPFIMNLSTNYGGPQANGYGGYGSSYRNETSGNQSGSFQMTSLRPKGKGDEYKFRIWSDGVPPKTTDAASVGSGDSKRMIIKKNLEWEVAADTK